MIDLTPILNAVIALAAALITAFLIPWIRKKIGAENMDDFLQWVEIAVAAAEQLYESTDGEKKKEYVVDFLEDKGFKFNMEELENAIEAAVLHLHDQLYNDVEIVQTAEVTEEAAAK